MVLRYHFYQMDSPAKCEYIDDQEVKTVCKELQFLTVISCPKIYFKKVICHTHAVIYSFAYLIYSSHVRM